MKIVLISVLFLLPGCRHLESTAKRVCEKIILTKSLPEVNEVTDKEEIKEDQKEKADQTLLLYRVLNTI